jgi:hypothetical protein
MQIKTIPSIYHTEPSEEIQYAFLQASDTEEIRFQ